MADSQELVESLFCFDPLVQSFLFEVEGLGVQILIGILGWI